MRASRAVAMVAIALITSCTVPSTTFTPQVDASGEVDSGATTDSGPISIVVSQPTLTLTEGSASMFTVTLSGQPAGSVLVDVSSDNDPKLGITRGGTLLFDATTWDKPATVMLTGRQDPDTADEQAIVTASTTTTGINSATVTVTVNDDDKLALVVSPQSLDVSENGSAPIGVHLNAMPAADVTVNIGSDNVAAATVSVDHLTFTAANYNIDQSVTVSGVKDSNIVIDTANVLFTSTAVSTVQVPVSVTDIDVLGIALNSTAVTMNEGDTRTVMVSLTQLPPSDVTVNIASAKPLGASVSASTMTFTAANWSQVQPLTITAPQDPDTANEAVSITLSATTLMSRTIAVAVTDDDVQAIVATPLPITMTENGDVALAVHLAFKPPADVTIAVSSESAAVATTNVAQVIFSPSAYATDQLVMVHAPDDADAVNNSTAIHLDDFSDALATVVPVAVTDDDVLTIQTDMAQVTMAEGSMATFQARLTAQPQAATTVAVTTTDPTAATVMPGALMFTTSNWNTYQTVAVTGVPDVNTTDEHVELDLTAAALPVARVTANVTDTTVLGLVVSTANLSVTEGSTATFTVALNAQPTGNVTVNIATGDPAVATTSSPSLAFTTANWNVAQVVTVQGIVDANAVDNTTALTLTATGLAPATVTVTDKDTNLLTIEANASNVTVGEGATATVGYHLTAQPTADVTVNLASSNTLKGTVAPASLVFTTANWATYQNVTVTGVQDADAIDENLTLTASATGFTSVAMPFAVIDDEVLGIVVDTPAVNLTEGGTTTFHAHLAAQPAADTMVTVTSSNTAKGTVGAATLTFTTVNWATDQTITVTGTQDQDLADESITITLASAGFPNRVVSATIADDDTQKVLVSSPTLTVGEQATGTIGVSLGFQPAANVVVSVTSADSTIATVLPSSLTFTPANYATPQLVTVSGVHDANAIPDATNLTMASAGATSATVAVTVPDGDTLAVGVSAPTLTISETGTGTFGVHLTAQPQASTTVTVTSGNTGKATVAPATLTFTAGNWNSDQTVTVTGVHDVDAVDATVTITASSPGLTSATVTATVTDVDQVLIVASTPTVALAEGGTATFTVKLAAQPQATVAVTVSSPNTAKATVAPSPLTFTTGNWNTAQTVTVTGVQDLDIADESIPIGLTATMIPLVTVTAAITDDDVEQILVSPGTISVNESASGTVGVTLRYVPSGAVTVAVASSDSTAATVSPATLVFTAGNYNVPQNVTITGVKDADAINDAATLQLTAPSVTGASAVITVVDLDTLTLVSSMPTVAVTEGGTTTFTLALSAQPAGNTTVNIASGNTLAATVSPAALTFTSGNWNTPQTITVTGVQDNNLANEMTSISVTSAPLAPLSLTTNVTDDDTQTILASTTSVVLTETTTAQFTVQLQFQPSGPVSVNVASAMTGVATVSPPVLNFTMANYATPQTVTVTGVHDANTVTDPTSVSLSSNGANGATVGVSVSDVDVLGIVADVPSVSMAEAGTATFNVHLNAAPASTVTVGVASLAAGIATVSPATLTFTTTDWNSNKLVTVTGVHDANLIDDVTKIRLSAATLSDVDVPVTVTDVDTQTVLSSASAIGLTEGQTGTVNVSLKYAPGATTTVTIATGNSNVAIGQATVGGGATLTFTTANYATPQSVTITAIHDANAVPDSTNLTFSAPGANGASTTVNVTDTDVLGISVSPTSVTVTEGLTASFGVSLTAQPTGTVTVAVASTNPGAATVSTGSLTFTTSTWNQVQNVTVTGAQDVNTTPESLAAVLTSASLTTQSVAITTVDDDVQAVLVSTGTVNVNDNGTGTTATVGVSLAFQPAGNLTVTLAPGNAGIATVGPTSLTFTQGNYGTVQNVTITGTHDANVVDDSTLIAVTASGATAANVTANVKDTDVMALVVGAGSPPGITVGEGAAKNFTVRLSNQPLPGAPVTVSLSDSNSAGATISKTSLTFDSTSWNVDQAVAVTGVPDVNLTNESATVSLTATGLATVNVPVTVVDDDTQAALIAPGSLTINELSTGQIQVRLAFQPSSSVSISVNTGSALSASPNPLTFTPANYDIPQTVTIGGLADGNVTNDTYTVSIVQGTLTLGTIAVTVIDHELISATTDAVDLTMMCSGDPAPHLLVTLNDSPLSPLLVTVTFSNAFATTKAILGVSPTSLSFDTGNYATTQLVQLNLAAFLNGVRSGKVTLSAPNQASVVFDVSVSGGNVCLN